MTETTAGPLSVFSIIPSYSEWTDKLRRDCIESVNLLMHAGKLDPETNYELRMVNGKASVLLWLTDANGDTIPQSACLVSARELLLGWELDGSRKFDRESMDG